MWLSRKRNCDGDYRWKPSVQGYQHSFLPQGFGVLMGASCVSVLTILSARGSMSVVLRVLSVFGNMQAWIVEVTWSMMHI